jgi:hypothetical protein
MLVRWSEADGLVAWPGSPAAAEYDVPDDEWGAYVKVLHLAAEIEDRMRAQYAIGPVIPPDLAALKGVLSDAEILSLVALRSGVGASGVATEQPLAVLPAPKPYVPPPCEHRQQTGGSRGDPTVRCASCGVVLIARVGVRAGLNSANLSGSPVPPLKADRHGFPDYTA